MYFFTHYCKKIDLFLFYKSIQKMSQQMRSIQITNTTNIKIQFPIGTAIDITANDNGEIIVTVGRTNNQTTQISDPLIIDIPEMSYIEDSGSLNNISGIQLASQSENDEDDESEYSSGEYISEIEEDEKVETTESSELVESELEEGELEEGEIRENPFVNNFTTPGLYLDFVNTLSPLRYRSLSFEDEFYTHNYMDNLIKKTVNQQIQNEAIFANGVTLSEFHDTPSSRPFLQNINVVIAGDCFTRSIISKEVFKKLLVCFGANIQSRVSSSTNFVFIGLTDNRHNIDYKRANLYNVPKIYELDKFIQCVLRMATDYVIDNTSYKTQIVAEFPSSAPTDTNAFKMGINYKHLKTLSGNKLYNAVEKIDLSENAKETIYNTLATQSKKNNKP